MGMPGSAAGSASACIGPGAGAFTDHYRIARGCCSTGASPPPCKDAAFQDGSMEARDSEFLRLAAGFRGIGLISQFPDNWRRHSGPWERSAGPVHLSIPTDLQTAELPADAISQASEPSRPVDLGPGPGSRTRPAGGSKLAILAGRLRRLERRRSAGPAEIRSARGDDAFRQKGASYDHRLCLGVRLRRHKPGHHDFAGKRPGCVACAAPA